MVRSVAKVMLATAEPPFEDNILSIATRTEDVDIVVTKLCAGSTAVMVPVVRVSVARCSVAISRASAIEVVCHSIL